MVGRGKLSLALQNCTTQEGLYVAARFLLALLGICKPIRSYAWPAINYTNGREDLWTQTPFEEDLMLPGGTTGMQTHLTAEHVHGVIDPAPAGTFHGSCTRWLAEPCA